MKIFTIVSLFLLMVSYHLSANDNQDLNNEVPVGIFQK